MKDKYGIEWTDMEITVRFPPEPPPPENPDMLTIDVPEEETSAFLDWWAGVHAEEKKT